MKNNENFTLTINCNRVQLSLMLQSLDLYSRLGIGQLEHVLEHGVEEYLHKKHTIDGNIDFEKIHATEDEARRYLNAVKLLIFNMSPNASFGIGSSEVSDSNKIVYDMQQVLRHELWKLDNDESNRFTVDAYPAMKFSHTQELLTAKIEK